MAKRTPAVIYCDLPPTCMQLIHIMVVLIGVKVAAAMREVILLAT